MKPGIPAILAAVPRNDPATGKPFAESNQVFYLDPVSGEQQDQREWGACCLQRENLIPFLPEFHYTLTLPGNWGLWLMGLVACAWVIDCMVALLLTLPRTRPFWRKWSSVWKIKGGHAYRLNYDLHRAGRLSANTTPRARVNLRLYPAQKQNPCLHKQTGVSEFNLDDDLLSHGETPHYHRRCIVSLLSSGWDQVVPMLYGRQEILWPDPLPQ